MRFTLLVTFAVLALSSVAQADTHFVDLSGNGTSSTCASTPTGNRCNTFTQAYNAASTGDTVLVYAVANGKYPKQTVPVGTKTVTFRAVSGQDVELDALENRASNIVFDNIDISGGDDDDYHGFKTEGSPHDVTFKNAEIKNIVDMKGAEVSGTRITFDNVDFGPVYVTDSSIHNECVYAIHVPEFVIRDSRFWSCATMDLFFTYGDWWTPSPPGGGPRYGDVTIEGNRFGFSTNIDPQVPHAYGLYVGNTSDPYSSHWAYAGAQWLDGWTITGNCFEQAVASNASSGTGVWSNNRGPSLPAVSGMSYSGNTDTGSGVVACP